MNSRYKIIISSDALYHELCAEIYFEQQYIGLIQERAPDNFEIEIHSPANKKYWTFTFTEFVEIAHTAIETLKKLPKPQ
jgi:hypothetical protein